MSDVNPLELTVTRSVKGVLETNIAQLEDYVTKKLEEYRPELYSGDAESAKKDRAELNSSRKFLSQARISLMKELMKPYADFEERCKALERQIDTASGLLDRIVKEKEEAEKEAKRKSVESLWSSKGFSLVPLERVWNPKWLNKTAKEKDISEEMDSVIKKIYTSLKTLEASGDDGEMLKSHYLLTLDLDETLEYGERMREAKSAADRESAERTEREHRERISEQRKEVSEEIRRQPGEQAASTLADEALGIKSGPEIREYVISVRCTDEQLLRLKNDCNLLGIEYDVQEIEF